MVKPGPLTIAYHLVTELEGAMREQFDAIYCESFPPNERESLASIDQRLADEGARLYGAYCGDDLVAFALMLPLSVDGVWLLDYFAVSSSWRNQGLGRDFLGYLRSVFGSEPDISGILLELESEEWGTEEERYLRSRRLAFYRRNGASLLPLRRHLRLPGLGGGDFIYTKLMWLPLRDAAPAGEKLSRCLLAFLAVSYRLPPDAPLSVEALESLQL